LTIAAERLFDLLFDFFVAVPGAGITERRHLAARCCFVDRVYAPVTLAEIRRIAAANPLRAPPDTPQDELNDCDDLALQVKALLMARRRRNPRPTAPRAPPAVGLIVAEQHAVNALVSATRAGLKLSLFDAGRAEHPLAAAPAEAVELLHHAPGLRWIFF
jgi:hypothetical protein